MDILRAATTQAKPKYSVITYPAVSSDALDLYYPLSTTHSPLVLEIGFGNGEFTVQYASLHPEIMLYGLEISQSCVLRCARRSAGLDNLKLINTDARYMLKELFPDESLTRIIMQFPCPWSGNANAHRRVTAKDFAGSLAAVLKLYGEFEFVSDDYDYTQEVMRVLGSHEALELVSCEINPKREITTKYERKWLEQGKNIHVLKFRKIKAFTITRQVEWQDMHIKIEGNVDLGKVEAFRNVTGQDEGRKIFWKFGRAFTSNDQIFLLEALTSDDEFEQNFYVNITQRGECILVRLDRTTRAFLTPAVRAALIDVSGKLLSMNQKSES